MAMSRLKARISQSIVLAAFLVGSFALQASFAQSTSQISLKDDWGREVVLPNKPARVVTLSAHLTEMSVDAGLSRQIVAIDSHSRAPVDSNGKIVRLSAYPEPSIENVAKLKPDLILLWGAGLKLTSVKRLESLGLKVFVSEPKTLSDIVLTFEVLLMLSKKTPLDAARWVERYKLSLKPRPFSAIVPVFVQVWSEPLMTIGQNSFMASALKHCGAEPLLAPLKQSSAVINPEAVVTSQVRAIVSANTVSAKAYWGDRALEKSKSWSFISMPESALSQPSTKLLDALTVLCERIDSLR
jgi:iron complex transport system substrate-binding protein